LFVSAALRFARRFLCFVPLPLNVSCALHSRHCVLPYQVWDIYKMSPARTLGVRGSQLTKNDFPKNKNENDSKAKHGQPSPAEYKAPAYQGAGTTSRPTSWTPGVDTSTQARGGILQRFQPFQIIRISRQRRNSFRVHPRTGRNQRHKIVPALQRVGFHRQVRGIHAHIGY